jgi:type IV secretory pathway VirB2 component (pilin)
VHYLFKASAGAASFGAAAAFSAAAALPGSGPGWDAAQTLLNMTGGVIAACLIVLALVVLGCNVMQAQYGETGTRP